MKPLSLAQSDALECIAKVIGGVTPTMIRQSTLESLWCRGLVSRQGDVYRITEAGKDAIKPNRK